MALSISQILQLICFSIMLAGGQTLFKLSATSVPSLTSINGITGLFLNVWFWAALVLYGTATLLWLYILQQIPLSIAYPFVALGFIFVPAIGWLLFKEPINMYYIMGVSMILGGLGFITIWGSR